MNLVRISMCACGHYSDAEAHEQIYITEESYNKMKDDIESIDIWIGGLDDKHSETQADIEIELVQENDLINEDFSEYAQEDNYILHEKMEDIYSEHGLNYELEENEVKKYVMSIDSLVEISRYVHKSQLKEVNKFFDELRKI